MTTSALPVNLLMHFGAGQGNDLARYLKQADRLVLVEPDPHAFQKLKAVAANQANVEVVKTALGHGSGETAFVQYNLTGASGFHAPAKLLQIYPGLVSRDEFPLSYYDAGEFVMARWREGDRKAALIIDVNGGEAAILDSLESAGIANLFVSISIHCGVESLFDGAMTLEDASARLKSLGFEDIEILGAGHARIVRGTRPASAASSANFTESSFGELKRERDVLSEECAQLKSEVSELSKKLENLERVEDALKEAEQALSEEQSKRTEAEARAEQIERNSLANAETERDAALSDLSARKAELDAIQADLATAKNEKETAQADLAVALRSQAMTNADLRSLQTRYGDLLEIKERQDDLLARLNERLSQAAEYLVEAPDAPATPEIEAEKQPSPASERTSSKRRKTKSSSQKSQTRDE